MQAVSAHTTQPGSHPLSPLVIQDSRSLIQNHQFVLAAQRQCTLTSQLKIGSLSSALQNKLRAVKGQMIV